MQLISEIACSGLIYCVPYFILSSPLWPLFSKVKGLIDFETLQVYKRISGTLTPHVWDSVLPAPFSVARRNFNLCSCLFFFSFQPSLSLFNCLDYLLRCWLGTSALELWCSELPFTQQVPRCFKSPWGSLQGDSNWSSVSMCSLSVPS